MARQVHTLIYCDVCLGSGKETEATETTIQVNGNKPRIIALCERHETKLLKPLSEALSEFGMTSGGTSRPSSRGRSDAKRIREWAQSQGIEVPAMGRVPRAVVEQYQAAH